MQTLFKIFDSLKERPQTNEDSFVIASLPSIKTHKIGISINQNPVFFIKCKNDNKTKLLDINLEYISVQYNRKCQLANKRNEIEEGFFTVIFLKTNSEDLQEYFLKIVYVLIKNISTHPTYKELKIEIDKLLNLFDKLTKPALKTIQGLWAELLVIEKSKDPDYLVKAWHNSKSDKYDFNDGLDKIEVKSTSTIKRIHSFSIEQLTPNANSKLIIISIFVVETGIGINIFDLMDKIESRLSDKNLIFRLNEMIVNTLGSDFEKSFEVYFDYSFASDSIKFFQSTDIPIIGQNSIPSNIINIRFDCDLSYIKPAGSQIEKSKLHKSCLINEKTNSQRFKD